MSIEWNGKGLPPVGEVCHMRNLNNEEYGVVKIIAHGHSRGFPKAIAQSISEDEIMQGASGEFRKLIKITPEQINDAYREEQISEICKFGITEMIGHKSPYDFAVALFDAGYRKQENK